MIATHGCWRPIPLVAYEYDITWIPMAGGANGPTIPPTRFYSPEPTLGSTEFEPQSEGDVNGFNWWPVIYAAIAVGGFISMSVVIGLGIKIRRQRQAAARNPVPAIGHDQV